MISTDLASLADRLRELAWHAHFTLDAAFGGGGSGSGGGGSSGGGSSSGGSGSSGGDSEFSWGTVFLFIIGTLLMLWWGKRTAAKARKAKLEREAELWQKFEHIAPGWTEETVEARVREAMVALNKAWSDGDAEAMTPYLTPQFHAKIAAVLDGLRALGRRNVVAEVVPTDVILVDAWPGEDTRPAGFRTDVTYEADDRLVNAHGEELSVNESTVEERWVFFSGDGTWLLDGVRPDTTDERFTVNAIESFATEHCLHYSADFGRMLLPSGGALFASSSMDTSDVNNHVIGYLRDRLVQLYTYVENPVGDPDAQIVVAQATLPISHHDILVRQRDARIHFSTDGLREHRLESEAFERKWEVHAHPEDDIATFELLHPAFLERLTDLPFEIGLEAYGSSLYVFDEKGTAPYEVMLDLLNRAFDELRM